MRTSLVIAAVGTLALGSWGCSSADAPPIASPSGAAGDEAAPPGTASDGGDAATVADAGPAPGPVTSSGCGGGSSLAGDLDWTIQSGGRERVVRVHLPPAYDATKPTPVVLNLHGRNSTASQQEFLSGMTPKADAAGFIVVYPTGVGQTWNGGLCCGQAQAEAIDDVAFTRALVDEAEKRLCVDKRRVFATGLSNGAFMANRLACELADRIAAIAPVAGQLLTASCAASRPVGVMHFHGTSDAIVPYAGQIGLPGIESSVKAWATRNGCAASPSKTYAKGDTTCMTYAQCNAGADVTLCTVDGGGHTWPGGFAVPGLGKTTQDIKAVDAMWEFFQKHPMP